jgi:serine/threonine protein kinase
MAFMFFGASRFTSDLNTWDTSRAQSIDGMFRDAAEFNSDLSSWDVSKVEVMRHVFRGALEIRSDLNTWDIARVSSAQFMFAGAMRFKSDLNAWDVSAIYGDGVANMFDGALKFTSDLNAWDVSKITTADYLFSNARVFSSDLSSWSVSRLTSTSNMFFGALRFAGDLTTWDTSNVHSMDQMFGGAAFFAGDISAWDVSNVHSMPGMFSAASLFDGDLAAWDVSDVQDMQQMFASAITFDCDLSTWDVSRVVLVQEMFRLARKFSGNLSAWDISSATLMDGMFDEADAFTSDLNAWDVSAVRAMPRMFRGATRFTSDLNSWDVAQVDDMNQMFFGAWAFASDLASWNVSAVLWMDRMFARANSFTSDLTFWPIRHLANTVEMFNLFTDPVRADLPCWYAGTTCPLRITVRGGAARRPHKFTPGVTAVDPAVMSATNTYRVGTTYQISPLEVGRERGNHTYRYSLVGAPPDGFYINPQTGVVLVTFDDDHITVDRAAGGAGSQQPLTVSLQVIADVGDYRAQIDTYTMHVEARAPFELVLGGRSIDSRYTDQYLTVDEHAATVVLVGQPFRVGARLVLPNESFVSAGVLDDITYTFKVFNLATSSVEEPNRLSIRPNGELLGLFTADEIGKHTVAVTAVDGGGKAWPLPPFVLDVRQLDVQIPRFGPNGKGCANNGVAVDDSGDAFDGTFTCNCIGIARFVGANCDAECASGGRKNPDSGKCEAELVWSTVLPAVAGAAVLLLLTVAGGVRFHRYQLSMRPIDFDELNKKMLENGTIASGQLYRDRKPRELRRSSLVLLQQVGSGAFGAVWKATLDESATTGLPEYQVAAKTVLTSGTPTMLAAAADDLTTEATVMAQLAGHRNVVSIIGVVTSGTPLILVLAYCDHGSLMGHLAKRAARGAAVAAAFKIDFGAQTARGMEHLAGRHFVHRDLAARNVLLSSGQSLSGLVCKVADFGLSRAGGRSGDTDHGGEGGGEFYYTSRQGTFPVRWTAPEAIEKLKFTQASDVWSFGVVAIEIIQDGAKPFPTIKSNPGVVQYTIGGGIHPMPSECDASAGLSDFYVVVRECFIHDPGSRPSFSKLAERLEALSSDVAAGCSSDRRTVSSPPSAVAHGYGRVVKSKTLPGLGLDHRPLPTDVAMQQAAAAARVALADSESQTHAAPADGRTSPIWEAYRAHNAEEPLPRVGARRQSTAPLYAADLQTRVQSAEASLAQYESRYDEVAQRWSSAAWSDELREVAARADAVCVAKLAELPLAMPNPWKADGIDTTSKRYLERLYQSFARPDSPTQRVASVCKELVAKFFRSSEIQVEVGPAKKRDRVFEKVLLKGGDFAAIFDYGRLAFVIPDPTLVPQLLGKLLQVPEFSFVRCKNRLDPAVSAYDSGGYRDCQCLVRDASGWAVELQLIPAEIFAVRTQCGHALYREHRHVVDARRLARADGLTAVPTTRGQPSDVSSIVGKLMSERADGEHTLPTESDGCTRLVPVKGPPRSKKGVGKEQRAKRSKDRSGVLDSDEEELLRSLLSDEAAAEGSARSAQLAREKRQAKARKGKSSVLDSDEELLLQTFIGGETPL